MELPCKMWCENKDPSYRDKEHIESIDKRVRLLSANDYERI